jgi:ribosomal protein S18 acetylase RimI-like enzyme
MGRSSVKCNNANNRDHSIELCIIAVNDKGDSIGCVVGKIDNEEGEDENGAAADDDNGGGGLEQQVPQQQQSSLPRNGGGSDGGGGAAAVYSDDVRVGYIGMLAVMDTYRRRGIGKALVQRILQRFQHKGCISAVLECERSNVQAQQLYQDIFGFVREELLVRYYINTCDAYRLRLWF